MMPKPVAAIFAEYHDKNCLLPTSSPPRTWPSRVPQNRRALAPGLYIMILLYQCSRVKPPGPREPLLASVPPIKLEERALLYLDDLLRTVPFAGICRNFRSCRTRIRTRTNRSRVRFHLPDIKIAVLQEVLSDTSLWIRVRP